MTQDQLAQWWMENKASIRQFVIVRLLPKGQGSNDIAIEQIIDDVFDVFMRKCEHIRLGDETWPYCKRVIMSRVWKYLRYTTRPDSIDIDIITDEARIIEEGLWYEHDDDPIRRKHLMTVLSRMKPQLCDVLVGYHIEGLTLAEVGTRISVRHPRQVKRILEEAEKSFRSLWCELGYDGNTSPLPSAGDR